MQFEKLKLQSKRKLTKQDFRLFLQDELASRCSRNPNYSLRSYAKLLKVSPSALSAMLSGKRPITHKMKERLGLKLGLSITDLEKFKSSAHGNRKLPDPRILSQGANSTTEIDKNTDSVEENYQQITIDIFSIISEPYHYALLELIKTNTFQWDPKWIAERLMITISEANIAIERLERVGLLERSLSGELFDATKGFSTDIREGLSSQAQRKFQQRSLEQAILAIQTVPVASRDNTSMTMAINHNDLPKAKKFIKDFRRRFSIQLEESPILDQVYQLTIAFVPLTKIQVNSVPKSLGEKNER
ncbi:MAG: TIGR02147 family protein [Bdellovibrionales bacterium]